MRSLNIIGCGRVGKTLGYLLAQADCYEIQNILCQHYSSALNCSDFFGVGQPVSSLEQLKPADAYMITVRDDQLQPVISTLATKICFRNSLVFHCSGSYTHQVLSPLRARNIASIHPFKSFSRPETDIEHFAGTYCTLEGEDHACQELEKNFTLLGAKIVKIAAESKINCHIAAIFSSNYVISLIDAALQLLEAVDIKREYGIEMLEPLLLGAFDQVKRLGTTKALTGPISRGDSDLVEHHLETLLSSDSNLACIYKALGNLTLNLARKDKRITEDEVRQLQYLLGN